MSDRFECLYKLQDNLYSIGSPIIISAGSLLKDKETGKVLVQMKFHSVTANLIQAVKLSLYAYDISGDEIQGVEDYQYLDLSIQNGQEFGSKKAIFMPDSVTRSFAIKKLTVIMSNDNIVDVPVPMQSLPSRITLQSELKNNELVKQYKIATNSSADYVPETYNDLWRCSCGEWNCSAQCTKCQIQKNTVFSSYDLDRLNEAMEIRLKEEEEQLCEKKRREEEQRLIEEKEKQRNLEKIKERNEKLTKNLKETLKIGISIIVSFIVISIIFNFIVIPVNKYKKATELMVDGKYYESIVYFIVSGNYKDSFDKRKYIWDKIAHRETISTGRFHTVGLKSDGTVVAVGVNDDGRCNVSDWEDIIAISAGGYHTVGLKSDGTVIAVGDNEYGQCDVSDWKDIVAISANSKNTVGLKSDGTVVATKYIGGLYDGQCNVSDWGDIVSVSAGFFNTISLKYDGTVIATKYTGILKNGDSGQDDVTSWKDIVSISAGDYHTLGLKANGTVVATPFKGEYYHGQCEVDSWKNIIAISAGEDHSIGLTANGDVVATEYIGDFYDGQCEVSSWHDIVAISTNDSHTVGIKSDGTVVATGLNNYGQCDVSSWNNIKTPSKTSETNIVKADEITENKTTLINNSFLYDVEYTENYLNGLKCSIPVDFEIWANDEEKLRSTRRDGDYFREWSIFYKGDYSSISEYQRRNGNIGKNFESITLPGCDEVYVEHETREEYTYPSKYTEYYVVCNGSIFNIIYFGSLKLYSEEELDILLNGIDFAGYTNKK